MTVLMNAGELGDNTPGFTGTVQISLKIDRAKDMIDQVHDLIRARILQVSPYIQIC